MYEITQIKGDGETHPLLSPEDEFADFETWDAGNLDLTEAKTDDMLAYEYAREALKNGLALEQKLGTNPYKFGIVGSTDSHTSLSTGDEDNYFGKAASAEPSTTRVSIRSPRPNRASFRLVAERLGAMLASGRPRTRREAIWMRWRARKCRHDRAPDDGAFLWRLGLHA